MRILAIYALLVALDNYPSAAQSESTYFGSIDPHIAINIPYADRGLDVIQYDNQLILVSGYVDALDQYNRKCDFIKVDMTDFSVLDIVRFPGPQGDLVIVEGFLNSDGYLYLTGEWYDFTVGRSRFFLARYTPDLEMVWTNYFPELDNPDFGYFGYDLCRADDGGVLVVYIKQASAPGDSSDKPQTTWVLKTDTTGVVEFNKLLPDSLGCSRGWGNVSPTGDGHYIITTFSPYNCSGIFSEHAIIHKIDQQGDIVWTVTRKGYQSAFQMPTSAPLPNGGVAVAMVRDSIVFFDDGTRTNFYYGLDGYDRDGHLVWEHDWWLRMVSYIEDLHPAANGDVLGCGYWYSLMDTSGFRRKGWIFRFSSSGELKWQRLYNDVPDGHSLSWDGETAMIMTDLTELDDGRIAITGVAWDSTDHPEATGGINANVLLMVLDSMGCLKPGCEGEDQFISSTNDWHVIGQVQLARLQVSPNPATGIAVVQWPGEPPPSGRDYRLHAYDGAGRLVWADLWNGLPLTLDTSLWPQGIVTLMCLHRGSPVAGARVMIMKP